MEKVKPNQNYQPSKTLDQDTNFLLSDEQKSYLNNSLQDLKQIQESEKEILINDKQQGYLKYTHIFEEKITQIHKKLQENPENEDQHISQHQTIQHLYDSYLQNYKGQDSQDYQKILYFDIMNISENLLNSTLNLIIRELKQDNINLNQINLLLIDMISTYLQQNQQHQFSQQLIHIIAELQKYLLKFLDIFLELIQILIAEDFLKNIDDIEIIGIDINLYLLQNKFKNQLQKIYSMSTENPSNFPEYFAKFIRITQFNELLELSLINLVKNYSFTRQIVVQEVQNFKDISGKLQLNNKFIIIGYLRELSNKLYRVISAYIKQTYILQNKQEIIKKYEKFIIEEFENYNFLYIKQEPQNPNQENEKKAIFDYSILNYHLIETKILQITDQKPYKVKMEEILKKNGHKGILLQISLEIQEKKDKKGKKEEQQEQEFEEQVYLLHKNSQNILTLVNARFISEEWYSKIGQTQEQILEDKNKSEFWSSSASVQQKNQEIIKSVMDPSKPSPQSDFFSSNNNNAFATQQQSLQRVQVGAAVDIGSSLGYCLANINNYPNTQEFLKDFGKTAAINGSLTYMITMVPVLGPLLLVGGLGYTSIMIYNNETASKRAKLKQTGKIAIQTGSGVGGTVGGALLGQALIPIPLLGALVGGLIGGFVGATASNQIVKQIDKNKVKSMIKELEQEQEHSGMWVYSKKIANIIGIREQFFYSSIPEEYEDLQDVWLTIVTFSYLAFFYGQQEKKEKDALEKKLEKEKKSRDKEFKKKLKENKQLTPIEIERLQANHDLDVQNYQQKFYDDFDCKEWPESVLKAQDWIVKQQVECVKHFEGIEEFILKVVKEA